ncbi:ATP-binding protein [Streptomyces sp. NPDC101118]|uniref:ATP-binding protein n=1 Tax=Streptomyces sp. NPDC101118 TaxID=3366109 RepID=UPI0037FBACB4
MLSPFLPASRATGCPASPPAAARTDAPPPEGLACSLTVPGEPYSGRIARSTVTAALRAHRMDRFVPVAEQVTGELVAAACHLNPGQELYLSARYRDDALRLIVYDGHASHESPRLAALCEARRRSALRLLAVIVRECGGAWGFGDSREPGGGTRTWVTLPRKGAHAYWTPQTPT